MTAPSPITDPARIRAMSAYDLFHPELTAALGEICRRTGERLDVPLAAAHAVLDTATAVLATNGGHTEFPAAIGGVPNELALCPRVVAAHAPYVVADLAAHADHAANPAVRMGLVRAYAGVPVTLPNGHVLGTHCVLSRQPRGFTADDLAIMVEAADEIVERITRYQRATAS
ncbi:hypothetical protein GCM10010123_07270 [Pilimelia anulata]|uniref:GAF domain-containing protein n=1 Tax=Pilimelia anulata TaxID=53371 RepID=A0A8J3FB31_9ACTN|nr:GAF domain-containing protein [Pilimelia anulata]GGJ79963.1 hypothetical protein GCM10010123_07270 [Pilimelia anulata]